MADHDDGNSFATIMKTRWGVVLGAIALYVVGFWGLCAARPHP